MKKETYKPKIMSKINWLLSHNKNYTKEQFHTIEELKEQLEKVYLMISSPYSFVGNGIYDDMEELLYNIESQFNEN